MIAHTRTFTLGHPIRPVPRWTESDTAMHEFNCADLDHMTRDAMERDYTLCGLAISLSNCRAHWWYQHRRDGIRALLEGQQR